jgi:hypothetical protein
MKGGLNKGRCRRDGGQCSDRVHCWNRDWPLPGQQTEYKQKISHYLAQWSLYRIEKTAVEVDVGG